MKSMPFLRKLAAGAGCALAAGAGAAPPPAGDGIAAFNEALAQATRQMDNAATLRLWAEDGMSLLPQTAPIQGKPALARFLDEVAQQLPGAHMTQFEMHCFDLVEAGAWASERCEEHQRVELPGGKPPFEGWGRMLLELRRESDGSWRLVREMWQPAPHG
jgi:ketosteroid isomerase-like protein